MGPPKHIFPYTIKLFSTVLRCSVLLGLVRKAWPDSSTTLANTVLHPLTSDITAHRSLDKFTWQLS